MRTNLVPTGEPAVGANPAASPAESRETSASPSPAPAEGVDEQALADVLAELDEIGQIDPQFKQELIADLRKTKPEMWGPTVQVYRSALAYRQQQAARAESQPPAKLTATSPPPVPAHSARLVKEPPARLPLAEQGLTPPPAPPADTYPQTATPAELLPDAGRRVTEELAALLQQQAPRETKPPAVVQVTHVQPARAQELTWEEHLQQAIDGLAAESKGDPQNAEELRRHVALRLLHLAAGRREEALQPIAGLSHSQHDFWSKQLYGLATYLDHKQISDPRDRAAAALQYLQESTAHLGELCPLRIRNLAFCSEVKSFGVYQKFEKYEFAPQQEVLLYAEVENFTSEETEDGFATVLRSSYQILDSRGQRVEAKEFPLTEELCQNRRHDFFMRYFIWIPKRIYNGTYTLQLTIEDVKNQKFNQASIQFEVKDAE